MTGLIEPPIYQHDVQDAARIYQVPESILAAVLQKESNWNPQARSPAGAEGIAQFMPGTSFELGVNPWVPSDAIHGAARYLRQQFDRFGNWEQALAAYNAGPGNWHAGLNYAGEVLGLAGWPAGVNVKIQVPVPGVVSAWNSVPGLFHAPDLSDVSYRLALIVLGILLTVLGVWITFRRSKS